MVPRTAALHVILAIAALLAGAAHAQTATDMRAVQRQVLDKAVLEADRLLAEAPPDAMALELRQQLLRPLALVDPARLRQSMAGLPEDARRGAEALALAGELARSPEAAGSLLAGQRDDLALQALALAARYLAQEAPEAGRTLADSQTDGGREGVARALLAIGLAERDADAALRAASEIQEQGQREAVFARIAEHATAADAALWEGILTRCYGRGSRCGL